MPSHVPLWAAGAAGRQTLNADEVITDPRPTDVTEPGGLDYEPRHRADVPDGDPVLEGCDFYFYSSEDCIYFLCRYRGCKHVNITKILQTFCKQCGKHQLHKVAQYKMDKDSLSKESCLTTERSGNSQTKPAFCPKAELASSAFNCPATEPPLQPLLGLVCFFCYLLSQTRTMCDKTTSSND